MKSKIVRHEEKKEIEYPCLMESAQTGRVYLFSEFGKGTLLFFDERADDCWKIGERCNYLDMSLFTPFHGEIILSNGG